ncbi:hypothetical protein HYZ99_01915 [Candidatus Peregrinibacteria bacterium]|nr:hypothetical protein [Candidatus Peregrinibacteria bacterium]
MEKTSLAATLSSFAVLGLLTACDNLTGDVMDSDSSTSFAYSGSMDTHQDLVAYLRSTNNQVDDTGPEITQPFFAGEGKQIRVNGEDVQVYMYTTEEAVEQDAANISADGRTVGTTQVTWIGEPHFFQDGHLLVLYLGNDAEVLLALEDALGPQFAGMEDDGSSISESASSVEE